MTYFFMRGPGKVGKDGKLEVGVGAHGETASEKHAPDDEVTGQLFRPGEGVLEHVAAEHLNEDDEDPGAAWRRR